MHNFEDKTCWKPMVKKYHASVSTSGNIVDVLDVHDHVVASFSLSIKFGKVALEEQLSHSLIVIPVNGDAESFSAFTYDPDENTIQTTIMKTNGEVQVFTATLDDLMSANSIVGGDSCHHHDKPFKPMEDELDPDFSYSEDKKHDDHCHLKPEWSHFEPHHKPLHDPYVTRSELMEESKKRQFNDMEIRKMLGENKKTECSVFGRLEALETGLKFESERSKNEDKLQKEAFHNFEHTFDETVHVLKSKDEDIKKALMKESHDREEACSELFRLSNLSHVEDINLHKKIEKLSNEHRRDTQVLRSQDRDLHNEIIAEQTERVEYDKELKNLIRIEETSRINNVKDVTSKIDAEYHRAKNAEEEIEQHLEHHVKDLNGGINLLKTQIETTFNKCQPKGEYVTLDDKGIILENTDVYYIRNTSGEGNISIGKLDADDSVKIGDDSVELKLTGSADRVTYNGEKLANHIDVVSLETTVTELIQKNVDLEAEIKDLKNIIAKIEKLLPGLE